MRGKDKVKEEKNKAVGISKEVCDLAESTTLEGESSLIIGKRSITVTLSPLSEKGYGELRESLRERLYHFVANKGRCTPCRIDVVDDKGVNITI